MKISTKFFLSVVTLLLAGILGLVFLMTKNVDELAIADLRFQQVKSAQLDDGEELKPLQMAGDMIVEDYFESTDKGYEYLGGIYDGPWKVGQSYKFDELTSDYSSDKIKKAFYGQMWGERDYYINIDRGDEQAPGDFLKTMDMSGGVQIDTLVVDFRFLRHIDFGSFLRLFNQISPARKIILGTIVDSHQNKEIISSGRPFFTANHTVFLIDKYIPDPVKHLVTNLSQIPIYHTVGEPGMVADSVCLYTQFDIGQDAFRICTEKWTSNSGQFEIRTDLQRVSDSIQMEMLRTMDEVWYKNQDSTAMSTLVPEMLSQLLP